MSATIEKMIYFLAGENWYARDLVLKAIVERAGVAPEYLDVDKLTPENLRELFGAQTLFSETRCIVLKQSSGNKAIWGELGEILEGLSDDITLIIVEDQPDKRTKTYKALKKHTTVKEFPSWTERDTNFAIEWMLGEAKKRNIPLKSRHARQVIQQVGVEQGRLASALEKIELMPIITPEAIEASIETHAVDNVLLLLETALRGDTDRLQTLIKNLRLAEDAYRVFGLLASQMTQLAALAYSNESPGEVAQKIGAPPFVLSKLAPFAARLSENSMRELLEWTAETDMQMKSVSIDPWILVEQLLLKIASR